ncbi:hypothetical protein ACTFIW_011849 [Dictyostelium discoideum]
MDITNNENLFWKVIHNKYLFLYIFDIIHNTEWVEYDDLKQIHRFNRIKFKNISSLEWIIKNKQFPLLKFKLMGNEFISIKETSIRELLNGIIVDNKIQENEEERKKKKEQSNTFKEALTLLIKYKGIQLLNDYNLVSIAIETLNLEAIKMLISTDSSEIKIISKHLEYIISNSESLDMLYTLINTPDINITISPETKDKSISLAFKNTNCKEELIQFILNIQKLYSIPSSSDTITKVEPIDLFSLQSVQIQNQLIELGYLAIPQHYITRFNHIFNGSGDNLKNKIKELQRLLSFDDEPLYYEYLLKYNEVAEEIKMDGQTLIYQVEYLKLKKLTIELKLDNIKPFFNNNSPLNVLSLFKNKYPKEIKNKDIISCQFIKLYTSLLSNQSYDIDDAIRNYIIKDLDNNNSYQSAINSISTLSIDRFKFPSSYDPFMSKYTAIISDKETIDWIFENWLKLAPSSTFLHKYSSCELLDYALEKFKYHPKLSFSISSDQDKSKYFFYPYVTAISNCDLKDLNEIYNRNTKPFSNYNTYNYSFYSYGPFNFKKQSIENIISLFNYLIPKDVNSYMFEEIFKLLSTMDSNHSRAIASGIKINSNHFINSKLFIKNVVAHSFSPNFIKLIFNHDFEQSLFNSEHESFNQIYFGSFKQVIDPNGAILFSNQKIDNLESCIEILVQHYKFALNSYNNNNQNRLTNYLSFLSTIISHHFLELVSVKSITVKKLKVVYTLIIKSGVELIENSDNSIYYLNLKSKKFSKYILKFPFILSMDRFYSSIFVNEDFEGYTLWDGEAGMLDSKSFSFRSMFGSVDNINDNGHSFDETLEILINNISHLPGLNEKMVKNEHKYFEHNYYHESFNYNLIYFLEIKRDDLFFKELEYILKYEKELSLLNYFGKYNSDELSFKLVNFKFSDHLINRTCNYFDSILFSKFISFNSSIQITEYLNLSIENSKRIPCLLKQSSSITKILDTKIYRYRKSSRHGKTSQFWSRHKPKPSTNIFI